MIKHCARPSSFLFLISGSIGLLASGCGPKAEVHLPAEKKLTGHDRSLQEIETDPVAFMERSLAETRKLQAFRLNFVRQERLGLIPVLQPIEHIDAFYRDDPFSVKFTWKDVESEYDQCTYVHGQNDNRVALLPRKGLFGAKPSVSNYSPEMAVAFKKARNPITDFGPRRLMERTLDRIQKAKTKGEVHIHARGVTELEETGRRCFHIELLYPVADEFPCKLQDLYINAETMLPEATYLWLTRKAERTPETLDAMYVYDDIDRSHPMGENTFVICETGKEPGADTSNRAVTQTPESRSEGQGLADD